MLLLARVARPLFYLAIASMAAMAAGCAGTPQHSSAQNSSSSTAAPSAAAITETPASTSELVETADFAKKAQDEGWAPEVRRGQVLYCKDETPVGSRLPERSCLNKAGVEQMMLAEERQRESMQKVNAAGKLPGS
jgi:hypothetical protein